MHGWSLYLAQNGWFDDLGPQCLIRMNILAKCKFLQMTLFIELTVVILFPSSCNMLPRMIDAWVHIWTFAWLDFWGYSIESIGFANQNQGHYITLGIWKLGGSTKFCKDWTPFCVWNNHLGGRCLHEFISYDTYSRIFKFMIIIS